MGATGHIGQVLIKELVKKGHKVRAIGRDSLRLKGLKAKGVEIHSGDCTDHIFLTKAFKGCNAIFSFIPPGYKADDVEVLRDRTSEAIVQAIAEAKISHVLNLSSMGADLSSGTGLIKELHHHEVRLNMIPKLNVLHFRPNYFMENLLMFLPDIKGSGIIATALKSDRPIPMVATHDIALKISEILDGLKFTGSSVFDFVGPSEISISEAVKALGKAYGKPGIKYVQLPYQQAEKELIATGMTHQLAKMMVEMYTAFNEGKIMPSQKLTAEHKGKITIEEFAKTSMQHGRSTKKAA